VVRPRSAAMTDILPYSDRKALQASTPTWGIEEIVRAQRMACDGATLHDIAEALNREPREVLRVVEQDRGFVSRIVSAALSLLLRIIRPEEGIHIARNRA
jgi:hypothetical protein